MEGNVLIQIRTLVIPFILGNINTVILYILTLYKPLTI